jgi:xanthine dehydrogenase accessory factor
MAASDDFAAVAAQVQRWLSSGQRVALARPIAFAGFSSRRPGEAVAVTETGEQAGQVLGPTITKGLIAQSAEALAQPTDRGRVIEVPVADSEAVEAGLACGGVMTVAIHSADRLPGLLWSAAVEARPVAVVSAPDGTVLATTTDGAVDGTLGRADLDQMALTEARRSLRQGRTSSRSVEVDGVSLIIDTIVPVTTLTVVGGGDLAEALERQAALLGWHAESVDGADAATNAVKQRGPADAVIVLSHDPDVDTPALAAGLASDVGYLGALGSRHTQEGRRERLLAQGITADQLGRIHGPAGLDIGARTPGEIALAIGAEILALRSGRAGTALKERAAPIND